MTNDELFKLVKKNQTCLNLCFDNEILSMFVSYLRITYLAFLKNLLSNVKIV